ncbi:hypothetical protein PFICI_11827 [Pestalotiopsis fici W106-1]|uniref:Amidohydrolase-related domain-containing protein n=1 Tax=Pestalotiopsis fici (strain W106-1 / CGMCC3.15140) TaxID=1229662 RepID=W3WRE7_PESFW|nr:uncharacterized protein PFICI_11827 [Pestalotiopsis fici W106-1]ETS76440.1 hypothetical protein PFICI_11827 [Pestalotiopsis fici W106-1]
MSGIDYTSPLNDLLSPYNRPAPRVILFKEANIVDVEKGQVISGRDVLLHGGQIVSIEGPMPPDIAAEAVMVDSSNFYLCPRLIDCHCHLNLPPGPPNLTGIVQASRAEVAIRQPLLCRDILNRGFTTIRDPAGSSLAIKQAIADGVIAGPRVFFAGMALSQTGGHGDMRTSHTAAESGDCCGGQIFANVARVVDGVPQCLRWAREELRCGADFLKIMAGGGVASPTDHIDHTQFTAAEIEAITTVAKNAGTYVTAHAYTPEAIRLAVDNGVMGIEHGNLIDEATAQYMAERGVYLTPTLATYAEMASDKWAGFLPPSLMPKNEIVLRSGLESLRIASKSGVVLCYGTDLIGPLHIAQARGLRLFSKVLGPVETLRTATINAAKLLRKENMLGQIKPNFAADLLVLNANPFENITIFERPKEHLLAVIKDGRVESSRLHALAKEQF